MTGLISDVFLIVLVVALIFHLYLFFNLFFRLAVYKVVPVQPQKLPSVSVVISAKNEDENLQLFRLAFWNRITPILR
jgi:hypothetical protein